MTRRPELRHRTSARKLAARKERADRWRSLFRPTRDRYGKKIERVQGTPDRSSKRAKKRELLAAAREINPAIKTYRSAKKLDQRLTRESRSQVEQRRNASDPEDLRA